MGTSSAVSADLLVLGAGPVGLFGTYYAGLRGLSVVVVDSLARVGGQVSELYPTKTIRDVAGLEAVRGDELVGALCRQALSAQPTVLLGERAEQLEVRGVGGGAGGEGADGGGGGVVVTRTSSGRELVTRAAVLTGGLGSFAPRSLEAAARWRGGGVVSSVEDVSAWAGRPVVVVGGGDSALDWALELAEHGARVTLVHRSRRLRAAPASVVRAQELGVELVLDATVTELVARDDDAGALTAVRLRAVGSGASDDGVRRAELVVVALGSSTDVGPLARWGLELDGRRVRVDSAMRTSVGRVLAAGDLASYEGKVPLLATGFGEVATAVNNAAVLCDPRLRAVPRHSTEG